MRTAKPEDSRELLMSIVTRIELYFDDSTSGRQKRTFSHGDIYVRPDAGELRSADPDSEVTQLSTKRPFFLGENSSCFQPARKKESGDGSLHSKEPQPLLSVHNVTLLARVGPDAPGLPVWHHCETIGRGSLSL